MKKFQIHILPSCPLFRWEWRLPKARTGAVARMPPPHKRGDFTRVEGGYLVWDGGRWNFCVELP